MTTVFVVALMLVFLRVAGFVAFLPPFSGRNVPQTVKVGLVICLTGLWGLKLVPSVAMELRPDGLDNWLLLAWLAIRETALGAGLGWLLGLILVPMRIAGAYVAQEMGLSMAAIASPTEASESNVLSQVFEITAVLLIFGLDLHHQFLRLFDATFRVFPLGRTWSLPDRDWFIDSIARTNSLGLALAAPVGILLFAGVVTTLVVMRQTPQFNLFTFGMPLRLVIGMGASLVFLPDIVFGIARCVENFTRFASL